MAPRLQGLLKADGDLAVALWGAGDLARLKLSTLSGPTRYGPNLAEGADGGLFVAQSAPALLVHGGVGRISPARRPARWDDTVYGRAQIEIRGVVRRLDLAWGSLAVIDHGGEGAVIAAGADAAELAKAMSLSPQTIEAEARPSSISTQNAPHVGQGFGEVGYGPSGALLAGSERDCYRDVARSPLD